MYVNIKGAGKVSFLEIYARQGVFMAGFDTSEKFFVDGILSHFSIFPIESFSPKIFQRMLSRLFTLLCIVLRQMKSSVWRFRITGKTMISGIFKLRINIPCFF